MEIFANILFVIGMLFVLIFTITGLHKDNPIYLIPGWLIGPIIMIFSAVISTNNTNYNYNPQKEIFLQKCKLQKYQEVLDTNIIISKTIIEDFCDEKVKVNEHRFKKKTTRKTRQNSKPKRINYKSNYCSLSRPRQ